VREKRKMQTKIRERKIEEREEVRKKRKGLRAFSKRINEGGGRQTETDKVKIERRAKV
jgi:hypothetical protein